MTDSPAREPAPAGPDQPGAGRPIATPPAGTQRDQDRTGQVGQKDSDGGPDGAFPDPDAYAGADDRAGS
jgi:hypothetical protein